MNLKSSMKGGLCVAALTGLLALLTVQGAETKTESKPDTPPVEKSSPAGQWRSEPPADCPFKPSKSIVGLEFTGRHVEYTTADTWYPSWAADGNLYSPWTEGNIGEDGCWSGCRADARTGQAKIIGDDPLNLEVVSLGTFPGSALPYGGRYPCATLVYNGIWYHGSQPQMKHITLKISICLSCKAVAAAALFLFQQASFGKNGNERIWLKYPGDTGKN